MKKENIIEIKRHRFAIEIVKASRELTERGREFILSKQLLGSDISIGANIKEAKLNQRLTFFIR